MKAILASSALLLSLLGAARAQDAERDAPAATPPSAPMSWRGQAGRPNDLERQDIRQQFSHAETRRLAPVERPLERSVRRLLGSAGSRLAVADYVGAIEDADAALASDSDNAEALYFRAAAQNLLGRFALAERDASRGLALSPADGALRNVRAWAYNRQGRHAEAIADANHALELDPRDPYAFANRAHGREGLGDYAGMAADLKAAAERHPLFEADYRESARRHGLAPDRLAEPSSALLTPRLRSFLTVLFFALIGGLLIGLGLLHVGSVLREQRAAAAAVLERRYELGRPIGRGGMGVIYEARDKRLGRWVAIKRLRDELKLDAAAKKAFIEEARTVAELHHPGVVDIHAVEEDGRGLYLVFERLEGRTLDEILAERQRLPLADAKRVLGLVCDALAYAHAHGVIHRDLKPANIMLTREGGVKLLDFGISRHAARADGAGESSVDGTPHYMAPEQEYGAVRPENDVFSLGAVLYEMATGSRPFAGGIAAKIARSYLRPSRLMPGLSLALDALIDRALEPDPERRLRSPAEFKAQLEALPD